MAAPSPDPLTHPLLDTARRTAAGLARDPAPVEALRRALVGPLTVVGAGGSRPIARLWAGLHAHPGRPARAPSPLEVASNPPTGTVLILSASGSHPDILGAAEAALKAGAAVHGVTTRADAPLLDRVRAAGGVAVALDGAAVEEGLATRHGPLPMAVLAAAVRGVDAPAALFDDMTDASDFAADFTARPRDVVALGAGPGRPAAEAFAHLMRESGLCPARAEDPREFAHGQFVAVGPETRLVVFGLAGQRWLAPFAAALPPERSRAVIEDRAGAAGAVALYGRAIEAAGAAMRAAEARPGREAIPPWGATLYKMVIEPDEA